jgi:hypothetical protein
MYFNDFPEPLVRDLHAVNIWSWQPVPTPPDPFAGGDVITDIALARALENRR